MTKFQEFMDNLKSESRPAGMMLDVTAQCQICRIVVDVAEFFPEERILVWWCNEGHRSHIENFSI